MKRLNQTDINTNEHYGNLYFSDRVKELQAYTPITHLLKRLVPSKGQVLDLGCGIGVYYEALAKATVYGTEVSEKAADVARTKGYKAVELWKTGDKFPYPDKKFDMIWCGEVIEHVENPQALIDLIHAHLKPGGLLILSTPFEDSIICPEHLWSFTIDDLKGFLHDFTIEGIYRFCNEPTPRWEHFLIIATT